MHIARYVKNTKKTAFFTQNRWFLPSKPWFCPISPYIRTWKSPKKCEKTLMRYQGFSRFFGPNPSIWDLQNHQKPWFWSVLPTPPKIIKNRLNFALSEKFSKPAKIHDFYLFWRQNYPPSNNLIHADIPKRTIFSRIPRTPLRL